MSYFSLGFKPALFFRISLYDDAETKFGPFIDFGAQYNFPVMFRHTMKSKKEKHINTGFHLYNDFSAFVRFGKVPISFYAEYSLSKFLKSPYPEIPYFRLGLSIVIPGSNY